MKRVLLSLALLSSFALPALAAPAIYAAFSPTGEARLTVTTTSSNVLIPQTGTPTIARITNVGSTNVFVLMGVGSGTVATVATGLIVAPGTTMYLSIGSNTYVSAITANSSSPVVVDLGN